MSAAATKTLLQEILEVARSLNGGSSRSFADAINRHYGYEMTSHNTVHRLEARGVVSSSDARLLALMAPFTDSPELGRAFSDVELLAIAQGKTLEDLIEEQEGMKMRVPIKDSVLVTSQQWSEYPSLIAGLLQLVMKARAMDRNRVSNELDISQKRLDEILNSRTPLTRGELNKIARFLNQYSDSEDPSSIYTANALDELSKDWDESVYGNGNGNGANKKENGFNYE